jgi:hypothetical protein
MTERVGALERAEEACHEVGLHGGLTTGDRDPGDERGHFLDLFEHAVETDHLAQGSAVDRTDFDTDITISADVVIDNHLVAPVEPQCHLGTRFDTVAATVALVDGVRVVAGDAIEVASLHEHDETVSGTVYDAKAFDVIEVPLGCSHD